jgi:LuxR family transcriptional regulator, maltose regulon positive regulatory protein
MVSNSAHAMHDLLRGNKQDRFMLESSYNLPDGYYLECDPDVLILRRLDGSMVGAFSVIVAAPEEVRRVVFEDALQRAMPPDHEPLSHGTIYDQPVLQARFFGHFEVLFRGEALPLGRNAKAVEILKRLLVSRTEPVTRDSIMGWLWPESSFKRARWSLNSTLHAIRKLLSGWPGFATGSDPLQCEKGAYRLCPTVRVETDIDEFDVSYERGRRLQKAHRTQEAAAEYEKAIELYRGDYLLEDLYEDWTMVERERLANAYVDMLGRLAVHYMEGGQYQEAIRACYRLLEKDRCHEGSYRVLMRCYVSLGLRGRALYHYRLCKEELERQYGEPPSSETQALRQSIIGGERPAS